MSESMPEEIKLTEDGRIDVTQFTDYEINAWQKDFLELETILNQIKKRIAEDEAKGVTA